MLNEHFAVEAPSPLALQPPLAEEDAPRGAPRPLREALVDHAATNKVGFSSADIRSATTAFSTQSVSARMLASHHQSRGNDA
ncbi:hypothetical protein [Methylopila sp. M107]|uniref:hypothetical protein n=1 Tax=Methylopila sp. M107 TaxID=1101190 RepID=UPI0012DE8840|nr:hypothetical protein [Methylopila sp. M107]